jgi:hypothetical protein
MPVGCDFRAYTVLPWPLTERLDEEVKQWTSHATQRLTIGAVLGLGTKTFST